MAEPQYLIVKLSSASGEIFEIAEAVAMHSGLVKNLMEDIGANGSPIPLPNVSSDVLQQVLQHCKRCIDRTSSSVVEDFHRCSILDAKFVGKVDMKNLYDLIMAANYMHVETLLHRIYCIVAMMIAKKKFGDIRQIFNSGNDFARGGEEQLIQPTETQILASFIGSLPMELQLEIKVKVGQRFHYGDYSPWQYDANAQMLVVELANLYDVYNVDDQVAIILLHVDLGLVKTLVLQTCYVMSFSPHQSEGAHTESVDQMEMDIFKGLINGIDRSKIENLIFDEETTY